MVLRLTSLLTDSLTDKLTLEKSKTHPQTQGQCVSSQLKVSQSVCLIINKGSLPRSINTISNDWYHSTWFRSHVCESCYNGVMLCTHVGNNTMVPPTPASQLTRGILPAGQYSFWCWLQCNKNKEEDWLLSKNQNRGTPCSAQNFVPWQPNCAV
jgi:hypothetical protein